MSRGTRAMSRGQLVWDPSISAVAWVGLAMAVIVVAVGLFGRYVAPYPPDEMFGAPFSAPSREHLLGLDFAGRDVLSRFLWGGQTAIVVALAGTHPRLRARLRRRPRLGLSTRLGRRGDRSQHRPYARVSGADLVATPSRSLWNEHRARRLRDQRSPRRPASPASPARLRSRSSISRTSRRHERAGERASYVIAVEILPNIEPHCWSTSASGSRPRSCSSPP